MDTSGRGIVERAAFKSSVWFCFNMHSLSDAKVIFAERSARRVSEGGGGA